MFNSLSGVYSNFKIYQPINTKTSPKISQLSCDTVSFKGAQPREYRSTFDYMISQSSLFTKEPYSSQKSPSKISNAIQNYIDSTSEYSTPVDAEKTNNTFCSTYSESLKDDIISTVNLTRKETFEQWRKFIENGSTGDFYVSTEAKNLSDKIKGNPSLQLVIWQSLASDISSNNRHIPLPLDIKTLSDTIQYFEQADKKLEGKELNQFRSHQAKNPKLFNEVYTSKLIENTLLSIVKDENNFGVKFLDETGKLIQNPNENTLQNLKDGLWVVIPSAKTNPKIDNVSIVENLSSKNWCTRSKTDKAEAALQDGDFYIFLGKENDKFVPQIGITSSKGKLAKIQGESNNNLLSPKYFDTLEKFLINTGSISESGQNKKCSSAKDDEGPDAYNQYLILREISNNPEFAKAIEKKDYVTFLNHLKPNTATYDEDGNIVVKNYNSQFAFQNKFAVALSDFGVNEVEMLKSIKSATGKVNTQNSPSEEIKKYNGKVDNSGNNLFESIALQEK